MKPTPLRLTQPSFVRRLAWPPVLLSAMLLALPGTGRAADAPPLDEAASARAVHAVLPGAEQVRRESLPGVALTPQILYETLLAEIAARRGNLLLATRLYNGLAKTTRDPRMAKRATEFAVYTRQAANALETAQIWTQTDPDSIDARLHLTSLLFEAKQADEAMAQLSQFLSLHLDDKTLVAEESRAEPSGEHTPSPAQPTPPSPPTLRTLSVDERLGQVYLLLSRLPEKVENARRFEQLTAPYEKFDRAQYFRGLIWFEAKDETRALSATERAIGLNPDWAEPVLLKARLQQRISTTQAEQTLKDFLVTHPKAGDVRLAYARSLIGDKRYEAARREYDQLLAATPDDGEVLYASALLAMQIDDFAVAERHMKRLLELGVGNPNLLRFYLGRMAEDAKQSDQAIAWYTQVTPGEQYLPALGRATALLSKNGHLEDGRALLQKAAAAYPQQQVLLLIAESQLLVDASRVADAYELLGKQLIQQPDQPELLYESALLAEKLDRLEVMERNLRQLIRIKPDDAHAYNALGYSLVERNLRLDEAAQLIDKGLALAPDDAFIIDSKGWLLYRRGERDAALLLLQKAYGIRSDPEIAAHLGEVLWVSGKPEDALKVWEAALKVRPDNRLLQSTLKKFKGASVDGSGKPAQGSSE